jgi:signal transduction histidine kinase
MQSQAARGSMKSLHAITQSEIVTRYKYIYDEIWEDRNIVGSKQFCSKSLDRVIKKFESATSLHDDKLKDEVSLFSSEALDLISRQRDSMKLDVELPEHLSGLSQHAASLDKFQYNCIGVLGLYHQIVSTLDKSVDGIENIKISNLLPAVTDNIKAFAIEKFGAVPNITWASCSGDPNDHTVLGFRSHIQFVYTELLKNSIGGMLQRYGAIGVDDAPSISISVSSTPNFSMWSIADRGTGIVTEDPGVVQAPFRYFHSSSTERRSENESNYHYSREFGAPFSSLGIGLVRASIYAKYYGGNVQLFNQPGAGVVSLVTLSKNGERTKDFLL